MTTIVKTHETEFNVKGYIKNPERCYRGSLFMDYLSEHSKWEGGEEPIRLNKKRSKSAKGIITGMVPIQSIGQSTAVRTHGGPLNFISAGTVSNTFVEEIPNIAKITWLFAWKKGALEVMCMLDDVNEVSVDEIITELSCEQEIRIALPLLNEVGLISKSGELIVITQLGRKVMARLAAA